MPLCEQSSHKGILFQNLTHPELQLRVRRERRIAARGRPKEGISRFWLDGEGDRLGKRERES